MAASDAGMLSDSPFHAGEHEVQERLGCRDIEEWARQVIRPFMPDQHRLFYKQLPYLVAAARDRQGRAWVTLIAGRPGFIGSPDARHLSVAALPARGDALDGELQPGSDIGFLGIMPEARRRNRVNGSVSSVGERRFMFEVGQSFGNCPQYIKERQWRYVTADPGAAVRSSVLSSAQRNRIGSADTFYIGSGYRGSGDNAAFGMDASHRGGPAGFVSVLSDRKLEFPDYSGNNHFNTLGNIVRDPRIGMIFVDFATGGTLQLTGRASITWRPTAEQRGGGALRMIVVEIDEVVEVSGALPLRWESVADTPMRVVAKRAESADVTSFEFDGLYEPLAAFRAGQHLPLQFKMQGGALVSRSYSLSNGPGAARYRISVKREEKGLVSRFLHDSVSVGDVLLTSGPSGDFCITDWERPTVLVGAGVGVTPMLSMLAACVQQGLDTPVVFVHGVRDGGHHPFAKEVAALAQGRPHVRTHVAYSRPRPEDAGMFDSSGRVDAALLAKLVPGDVGDAQYFLCGPSSFMSSVKQQLEELGVSSDDVHYETFGA
eukprot:TRINITY_DN176_c0_g2_i11.p1 TRINITY_DN176_c0_g2~~TRINITY_DN176_c0_g2_i11.p1  ORF type:complete len:570 (+),score=212.61 TRINITY_DN176_c0_g2_i11:76-1710(+)